MSDQTNKVILKWDSGTAYDFFISLQVLHDPDYFGLRSSWASGMRQRLPKKDREILATFISSVGQIPHIQWLSNLPAPKNSQTALNAFGELSLLNRVMVFIDITGDFRSSIKNIITNA